METMTTKRKETHMTMAVVLTLVIVLQSYGALPAYGADTATAVFYVH